MTTAKVGVTEVSLSRCQAPWPSGPQGWQGPPQTFPWELGQEQTLLQQKFQNNLSYINSLLLLQYLLFLPPPEQYYSQSHTFGVPVTILLTDVGNNMQSDIFLGDRRINI